MPVDRIQVGGSNPSPDRQDYNLVAGNGITVTAADDSANNVSKATIAVGGTLPAMTGGITPSVAGYTTFWSGGVGVALATSGNDTANTNGDVYWCQTFIPCNTTITGVNYLIGSVGGTDKVIVALYSSTGVLLANSALAGVTTGTAANFQAVPFTAPYAAVGPAVYYVAVQMNGTTAKWRSHTAPGLTFVTGTVAGTFGTLAAITPGTTYTANKGPIACTY